MRILAGGPARETTSDMFRLHVEALEAQTVTSGRPTQPDLEITVHHELVPDDGGPRWHMDKIERVAVIRQKFMDRRIDVKNGGIQPHALFMVDTDVIVGPGVLERMWQVDADVVYGVFWTRCDWGNAPGIDLWPQVWDVQPYRFTEECWNELTAPGINEVEVFGGGACTLIRGRGFESHYWPLLESIKYSGGMWAGEDRSFNIGLESRGITQIAVTGLPIVHLYTDELQTPDKLDEAREKIGLFARVAD